MERMVPYKDDPDYYKQCIATINTSANFPMYLYKKGYRLIAKSAGSLEFSKNEERIVVQTNRSPMSYFNRNDSLDKGRFFGFLVKRCENFYKAIALGMEISQHVYDRLLPLQLVPVDKETKVSLVNNYAIVPLQKKDYLIKDRSISEKTLRTPSFKGRIFNANYKSSNGGTIANIAFPKLDLEGNPQNYILYNKPFRNRLTSKFQKFRMVLNNKDHYLFYSNLPTGGKFKIVFGESGIDLLSYHELHPNKQQL